MNIGLKVYKGTETKEGFKQVTPCCMSHTTYKVFCQKCNKEQERKGLLKEIDGRILTQEEIKALDSQKTDISIISSQMLIDAAYFEDLFYLEADKGFQELYILISETLRLNNLSLIGKVTLRNKERFVSIESYRGYLRMFTLRYRDEIRDITRIPKIETAINPDYIKMAKKLIDGLHNKVNVESLENTYQKRLKELLEYKEKGILEPKAELEVKPGDLGNLLAESIKWVSGIEG